MNGRFNPFENGPEHGESERLGPATVVDVTYDEPGRPPQLRSRIASAGGGGGAHVPRPAPAPQVQLDWDEESDTQVMGPRHIAPAKTENVAALQLDWDNDDSNTEKWQPRHAPAAPPRKVPPRPTSGVRPAVQVKPAEPVAPASPEDVIEELREQLIEVLERARTSEARAVAAERRVQEAEKGRSALEAIRDQLSTTIERARSSEAAHAAAERRAEESEQDAQEALQRLSEQLMHAHAQIEASEVHSHEAAQRAALAEQTVQHARGERQVVEESMARALRRASTRSSMLFGLSVVLLAGCAAAGYFVLYAPMQQRAAAQQTAQTQEASRHSQELSSLQARLDSEHQEFEATRRQLESQLAAAGGAGAGKSAPDAVAEARMPGATRPDKAAARAEKSAPEAKKTISADKAAPASRRGHHAKAEAGADDASDEPKPEPKRAAADKPSDAPNRDNDPLEGL